MDQAHGVDEREFLLQALKGYLEELRDTGVDALEYGEVSAAPLVSPKSQSAPAAETVELSRVQTPAESLPPAPVPNALAEVGTAATPTAAGAVAASEHPAEAAAELCSVTGDPQTRLLVVTTGDGFQGEAGELLANIVKAMGFERDQVCLITFTAASPGELGPLRKELLHRIAAVAPEAVVAFGEPAAQVALGTRDPLAKLRGRFHNLGGIPLMPTLHAEDLVVDVSLKRQVWNEMQQVMKRLAENSR
ncbi:uracil-DNA glycosylase [Geomonas limicola]|uniref:Uracil-DNA glycosylase n=1 Tax=Geomonas limicola TaxID=2740186 RepID=A0A6V8N915_9BACT|nr:uracil-DNA glycosylase family protein [Geomonas limicola]GFO69082.1 uracil-DNA glycosylase [Geomonas limicola]